jgi:iron complex transport system permease protein
MPGRKLTLKPGKSYLPGLALCPVLVSGIPLALGKRLVRLQDMTAFFFDKTFHTIQLTFEATRLLKNLLIDIRLPRITATLPVGTLLSASGVSFQAMFVNPIVPSRIMDEPATGLDYGNELRLLKEQISKLSREALLSSNRATPRSVPCGLRTGPL